MTGSVRLHNWARRDWRRGGRWDRILAALYRQALTAAAIRHATQTGEHRHKAECKKVKRALADMTRVGLIQPRGDLYEITARGSRTLVEGRIPPAEPARRHSTIGGPEQAAGA